MTKTIEIDGFQSTLPVWGATKLTNALLEV